MNVYKHSMKSTLSAEAHKETLFVIAAARADGASAVCFEFSEQTTKTVPAVKKALRSLKRRGVIQMLASKDDFENETTEAVFLLNKFPEIEARSSIGELIYAKL